MDDARARILNAAGPIFARKGYSKTTVREICSSAGVNLAGVNYHFGDKERLYIESVKAAQELRVEQVPLREWPAETPPNVRLADFIKTLIKRLVGSGEAPWQIKLMMREILQPTAACKELVEDYFRPHFERLLFIVDEVLPPDTPTHRKRQIGFSIVGQCVYYRIASEVVSILVPPDELAEHFTVDRLADHITEFTLAALGLGTPLGRTDEGNSVESSCEREAKSC